MTLDGGAVKMPTPYDNFTRATHHKFDGGLPAARIHRALLLEAMDKAGFKRNPIEWWHYELTADFVAGA